MKFLNFRKIDNHGGLLVSIMIVVALAGGLLTLGSLSLNTIFKNYSIEKDNTKQRLATSAVQTLFSDRRFCNAFFPSGYNTNSGTYDFSEDHFSSTQSAGHQLWMKNQVKWKLEQFDDFFVRSIELKNPIDLPANSIGQRIKQFEIGMTIQSANPNSALGTFQKMYGGSGNFTNDINEKLFLLLSEGGECYLRKGLIDPAATGLVANAVQIGCGALGGTILNGRCHMKEYSVDPETKLPEPYEPSILTKSNLSEAFCEMELNILKKGKIAVATPTKGINAAWTTLCTKPAWSGCVEGSAQTLPDEAPPVQQFEMKQKDVNGFLDPLLRETMLKRSARILATQKGVDPGFSFVRSSQYSAINLATSYAFGGLLGLGIALLFKCNKAKVTIHRVCKNQYLEIERVEVRKQKTKFPVGCKWKGPEITTTPSDEAVFNILNSDQPPRLDFSSSSVESEIEDDYTKYLNSLEDQAEQ